MGRQSTSAVLRRGQPSQWDVSREEDIIKVDILGWEFSVDKIQPLENCFKDSHCLHESENWKPFNQLLNCYPLDKMACCIFSNVLDKKKSLL